MLSNNKLLSNGILSNFVRGCFPLFLVHHSWLLKSQVIFLLLDAFDALPPMTAVDVLNICLLQNEPRKKPFYFPIYWLLNRDPYDNQVFLVAKMEFNQKTQNATLLQFNKSPLKRYRDPKGNDRLPTIIFRGLCLNFGGVYPKLR